MIPKAKATSGFAVVDSGGSDNSDDESAALARARNKPTDDGVGEDAVKREIDRFIKHAEGIDWIKELEAQDVPGEVLVQLQDSNLSDSIDLVAKHFDVMKWWSNTHPRTQYPLVYIIACLYLILPESNGNQERTFSAATWMDGKLSQRQCNATHEMKTLLYRNREHLQKCKVALNSELEQRSAAIVQELLDEAKKARSTKPVDDEDTTTDVEEGDAPVVDVEAPLGPDVDDSNPFQEDEELQELLEGP